MTEIETIILTVMPGTSIQSATSDAITMALKHHCNIKFAFNL